MGIPIPTAALGLPWGLNFNPHTHPIPIPMESPYSRQPYEMVIQCNPFVANPPFLKSWEIRLPPH